MVMLFSIKIVNYELDNAKEEKKHILYVYGETTS